MCRGFQQIDSNRNLKIKSFSIFFSLSKTPNHLPDSLTLHYLPRINGAPLEINHSQIRPDSPAFLTLYRLLSGDRRSGEGSVLYGSRERVRVSEGVRFEVYLREEKVVKGSFRKNEGGDWKMECKCGLEGETAAAEAAEVEVVAEGAAAVMRERVEMVVRRKRRRCFEGLEEIPEQASEGEEEAAEECGCCECRREDGAAETAEDGGCGVEAEVEGVRWAVDVGIWVVCLGVGYLVSKASSKRLRRRRFV